MNGDPSDQRPRTRRWFQFSLRALLVFVTVAAILSGWLGVKMHNAKTRHDIVKAITDDGGRVRFNWQRRPWTASPSPYVPDEPKGPAWLRNLLTDEFFNDVVDISWPAKDPKNLRCLSELTTATDLTLDNSAITDEELKFIGSMSNLGVLRLHNTQVTDAGLDSLTQMKQLKLLGLNGTQVTKARAKELKVAIPGCRIVLNGEDVSP